LTCYALPRILFSWAYDFSWVWREQVCLAPQ
jgi:hypothetical protein